MERERVLLASADHCFDVARRAVIPWDADDVRPQRGALGRDDIPMSADKTDVRPRVRAFAAVGRFTVHQLIPQTDENLFEQLIG